MTRQVESESRSGPRYLASLEVRAEWDEPSGTHVIAEGTTENVGPEGTLVHLPRQLPDVGSRHRRKVRSRPPVATNGPAGSDATASSA